MKKRAEVLASALGDGLIFCLSFGVGLVPTRKAVSSRFSGNRQILVGISDV
jgi:hypothetical protein